MDTSLNYLHKQSTNPNLNVRTADLPLLSQSGLGTDESGTQYWGHISSSLFQKFNFTESMFYCNSSDHSRVIHFKTSSPQILSYMNTGNGTMAPYYGDISYSTNLLKYNNASIPLFIDIDKTGYTSRGDASITEFPIFGNSAISNPRAHWGIRGAGNRWECDNSSAIGDTHHQIYIR